MGGVLPSEVIAELESLGPVWQSSDCRIVLCNCDCLEGLKVLPEGCVDAVVTDPEYGIGWNPRVNHKDAKWRDTNRFDPLPWLGIGTYHLFWGGNYFADRLPVSNGWLAWVKRPIHCDFSNDHRSYSTVELAWSDFGKARFIKHVWDGGMREGDSSNREFLHPAQKPVEVMIASMPPIDAAVVCDPEVGSGTTAIACIRTDRSCIGMEIDRGYWETAVSRCKREYERTALLDSSESIQVLRQQALPLSS